MGWEPGEVGRAVRPWGRAGLTPGEGGRAARLGRSISGCCEVSGRFCKTQRESLSLIRLLGESCVSQEQIDPKGFSRQLPKLIREFNISAGYKVNIQKPVVFLYLTRKHLEERSFKNLFIIVKKHKTLRNRFRKRHAKPLY